MKKSKIVDAKGGVVFVSSNLQTAFIFFVFLAHLVSSFLYFWSFRFDFSNVSTRAWAEQLLYFTFPVILLAVSYMYTKQHKSGLNKLFVATLKAVCANLFFGLLVTINGQVAIATMQDSMGPPPAMLTSIWNTVILMSFTFAVFVGVLHFWMYDKKSR